MNVTLNDIKAIVTAAVRDALPPTTSAAATAAADTPTTSAANAEVFGLRGICELFNVSHPTAQRYKNTFLAPAISQRGRKIVVNVAMAKQLFNERNNAQ